MNLPVVTYSIVYNAKDITRDISEQVISLEYTDKLGGESDTLEITLEDKEERWQNEWYPEPGDSISLIIRQGDSQLNCGTFEVDEKSSKSSNAGDIFTIKALATGIKKKLRTKKSYAHEDKSLREIANTVAADLGLAVLGTIQDIRLNRSHQYRETALEYLNRLGNDYGYVFSVRGPNLIFTYYKDLENRQPSFVITKKQLIDRDLTDTTHKTFKKSRIKHHDAISNDVVEFSANYDDDGDEEDPGSEDELELRSRVENRQQAEAKSKYALFKNNTAGVGGDIVMPGNLLFLSGNNFQLNSAGKMSGIFHILESRHYINRAGGYQTSGNIKRVKTIDPINFK